MKTIDIKAGERKNIISVFSSSIPCSYQFSAKRKEEGAVSGKIEIRGSQWIIPKNPVYEDLSEDNQVHKGCWDSLYKVYVTPDVDVLITLPGSKSRSKWLFITIIIISIIIALAMTMIILISELA